MRAKQMVELQTTVNDTKSMEALKDALVFSPRNELEDKK